MRPYVRRRVSGLGRRCAGSIARGVRWRAGTFLVITKLVPCQGQHRVYYASEDRGRCNIPMAKLEVMANARPIHLYTEEKAALAQHLSSQAVAGRGRDCDTGWWQVDVLIL